MITRSAETVHAMTRELIRVDRAATWYARPVQAVSVLAAA
jgi:hypothetical protein